MGKINECKSSCDQKSNKIFNDYETKFKNIQVNKKMNTIT